MFQNFHVVFYVTYRNVTCRTYVTVRYGSTCADQRYVTVSYVTLRYARVENRHFAIGDAHYVDGVGPGIGARVDRDTPYRPGVQA